jgi:exodeoxyribonuclease-3
MRKAIVLFLFIFCSQNLLAQKALKIISYNVYNYFESEQERKQCFISWAKAQDADVIAYQELVNISAMELQELGKSIGHPYTELSKEKGYAVGISSKYPITKVKKVIKGMHHGFMAVNIKDLNFITVHLSPFSHEKRREEIATITDSLQRWSILKKTMILGDMNSLAASDSLDYNRNGRLSPMLKSDESSKISNANHGHLDYTIPSFLLERGFIDTWAMKHQTFDYSYPSLVFGDVRKEAKERIDYIFISKDLKPHLSKSAILKDVLTDKLSDHYPVSILLIPPHP